MKYGGEGERERGRVSRRGGKGTDLPPLTLPRCSTSSLFHRFIQILPLSQRPPTNILRTNHDLSQYIYIYFLYPPLYQAPNPLYNPSMIIMINLTSHRLAGGIIYLRSAVCLNNTHRERNVCSPREDVRRSFEPDSIRQEEPEAAE